MYDIQRSKDKGSGLPAGEKVVEQIFIAPNKNKDWEGRSGGRGGSSACKTRHELE